MFYKGDITANAEELNIGVTIEELLGRFNRTQYVSGERQMKLYCVMTTGNSHGLSGSYIVAHSADHAYNLLKKFLDKYDLGFECDRNLSMVNVVADENRFQKGKPLLILDRGEANNDKESY